MPVHEPLFPGYLFLLSDQQQLHMALGTGRVVKHLEVIDQEQLWDELRALSTEVIYKPQVTAEQLPAQLQAAADQPAVADRLSRFLAPHDEDLPARAGAAPATENPTARRYRDQVLAFRRWLARRYESDGEVFDRQSDSRRFYREAAEEYRR